MDEDKIRQIAQQVFDENSSVNQFAVSQTPYHTHNGVDSPTISDSFVTAGLRASGNITFAQSTVYRLGVTFNASTIWFYGSAIRRDYIFTVTAANATVGDIYTNNGASFTVLQTIAGGTTLKTVGTGAPAASGTLTKSSGSGDATITFASSSHTIEVRAHCVGSAQIGPTFYFQPQTSTSVQEGGPIQGSIQSSSMFLVDSSASTLVVRALSDEGNIVDVEYSVDYGTSISGIVARSTVTSVSPDTISITVVLATGWEIDGNYVIF